MRLSMVVERVRSEARSDYAGLLDVLNVVARFETCLCKNRLLRRDPRLAQSSVQQRKVGIKGKGHHFDYIATKFLVRT